MNEIISVIVPIYKVAPYLRKCVDSICNQTHQNLEIILVDDGSPDDCGNICDEYALKDSRIQVIHKENGGLSDARNAGIGIAHGEYISFVDSDDYVDENMIETLLAAIISEGADISLCGFTYVNDDYHIIEEKNKVNPIKTEVLTGIQAIEKLLTENRPYYTIAWNKLYRASLFNDVRFPKGKQNEDEFVSHILFGKSNKVACIGESYYFYVQRSDSIMGIARACVSIKDLDFCEALIQRALYIANLGQSTGAGKCYFDASLRISNFLAHYKAKSPEERLRMKEMHQMLKDNRSLKKNCGFKDRIQIILACISPRLHQFLIGITH